MKVVFLGLSIFDQVGGIQRYSKDFLMSLSYQRIEHISISLHDHTKTDQINYFGCNGSKVKFILKILRYTKSADIVVWNHISIGIIYYFLRLFLVTKKNILLVYGTEVWLKNLSHIKLRALQSFSHICSISEYTKNEIIKTHGINPNIFSLLPCTIINKNWGESSNPYAKKNINILTISRLNLEPKIKAIYRILDVIPELLSQGFNVHFTIIGSGTEIQNIKEYAANKDISKNISLLDYVENTQPYLEHCDLFALVSEVEGFGIVFLEAMQFGRCCISASDCGSDDVVIDGKTGFTINVNDPNDLKRKISILCKDKKLREVMGNNGRRLFEKKFIFKKFSLKQMSLLHKYGLIPNNEDGGDY